MKPQPECRVNIPALGGWVSPEKAAEYFKTHGAAPVEPRVQQHEEEAAS